jgi:hypothetical protein
VVDRHTPWTPPPSQDAVHRAHARERAGTSHAPRDRAPTRRGEHAAPHLAASSVLCALPVYRSCRIASLRSSLLGVACAGSRTGESRAEPCPAAAYRSCHRRELRLHSHTPPPATLQPPCNYPGRRCSARTRDPPARRAPAGAALLWELAGGKSGLVCPSNRCV